MTNDYIFEKLMLTIDILTTGKGRIKDRLKSAVISQFFRIEPGHNDDIPKKYYDQFKEIKNQLTCVEPKGNEGTYEATIDSFSEDEAVEITEKIFSFYHGFILDMIHK